MTDDSKRPKVSVIIPCYNQARFLPDAVNSVLAQTESSWECIIVNDGSPDNTREVATEFASRDPRIRYVEQANMGLSGARNTGLSVARGRYIQFLDSDDYVHPTKLEKQLASIPDTDSLVVSYTDIECVTDGLDVEVPDKWKDPRISTDKPLEDIIHRFGGRLCLPPHSFLFDARIFSEHGVRFDTDLPACEDFFCWINVFALRPIVVRVDEKLICYRWHAGSMMRDDKRMQRGYYLAVRKARMLFPRGTEARRVLDRRYSDATLIGRVRQAIRECAQRLIGQRLYKSMKLLIGRSGDDGY